MTVLQIFQLHIFWISQTDHFWNLPNWNFFLIFKIENWIFQVGLSCNFPNCKFSEPSNFENQQISRFFQFEKPKFSSKNYQSWNRSSVRNSVLLANLPILIFSFAINQFSHIFLSILVTRKFGHSKFESSLIFKFATSTILKFLCSKFQPSFC